MALFPRSFPPILFKRMGWRGITLVPLFSLLSQSHRRIPHTSASHLYNRMGVTGEEVFPTHYPSSNTLFSPARVRSRNREKLTAAAGVRRGAPACSHVSSGCTVHVPNRCIIGKGYRTGSMATCRFFSVAICGTATKKIPWGREAFPRDLSVLEFSCSCFKND